MAIDFKKYVILIMYYFEMDLVIYFNACKEELILNFRIDLFLIENLEFI